MLKKLLGETVIYGLSSILGRTLNYLLVPLYTTVFLPEEYGIVTELYAHIAFLNVILTYGMETTFFRFATKDKEKRHYYFNLCQTAILFTTILFGGILYFNSDFLANILEYPDQSHLLRWLALIICFDTIVALPFAQLRLQGKAGQFAAFKLSNIVLNISFNLFFLLLCPYLLSLPDNSVSEFVNAIYDKDLGVGYVFLSNLLANGLYLLFFIKVWVRFKPAIDWEKLREVLGYALPLLVLGLAGVTNEMLSRSMLRFRLPQGFYEDLTNLAALGVFGAVYKLSIFMTLVVQAFKYAYEPFFFQRSSDSDAKDQNSKVMNGFIIFTCFGWLGITMVLPELAPIFLRNPVYLTGLSATPLLLGGGVFLGIFYNLSVWYKLTDNNWYGALITLAGAILTFAMNWTLIPYLGYMGSAWTTFFTYFMMMILSYYLGRKYYPVPYKMMKAAVYLIVTTISVFIINFGDLGLFNRYAIGTVFLFLLALLVFKMEKLKGFPSFAGRN